MRKNVKLLLLIVLALVLVCSLVACGDGSQQVSKTPDEVGSNTGGGISTSGDPNITATPLYLSFTFDGEMSSVFHSILIDDFDLSNITYNVVYRYTSATTSYTAAVEGGALTLDMIDESCRSMLTKKGKHNISVSADLGAGTVVTGTFPLYLRESINEEKVTLTFNLDGGTASFGEVVGTTATVSVIKGGTFSWDEFVDTFRMNKKGYALQSVTYGTDTFDASSAAELTINNDITFKAIWTQDVVSVDFNINAPEGATFSGEGDPALSESLATQSLTRNVSKVTRPVVEEYNRYNGYQFGGWYLADGTLWNFNNYIGKDGFTLTAKWVELSYSATFYTMGGEFDPEITSSIDDEGPITLVNAQSKGYSIAQATVFFDKTTHQPARIVISGMKYGVDYSKYVAQIKTSSTSNTSVVLRIVDLSKYLVKGISEGAAVYTVENWYSSSVSYNSATKIAFDTAKVTSDINAWINWQFNSQTQTNPDALNSYYVNYLFKDNLVIRADGTLAIKMVVDAAVSNLIIPATITYDGVERKVTEIAADAGANLKALVTLDLSNAVNLTIVGARAFANSASLSTVTKPTTEAITSIGEDVFLGTSWFNNYKANNNGKEFIVINKILYAYVGEDSVSNIDLSKEDYYTLENTDGLDQPDIDKLNAQLHACDTIAAGCFENFTQLQSITLHGNIESIDNNAFSKAIALKKVNVPESSRLKIVGEEAFKDTEFVTSSSGNYNPSTNAIIIGNVYYRFLETKLTSAIIPSNITSISAQAFIGAGRLANITFANASAIEYVGADAFVQTAWVRSNQNTTADSVYVSDGFVVINGILANFIGDKTTTVVSIPNGIKTIVKNAFSNYAQSVTTIQFSTDVTIEDYAFAGAAALENIVLVDAMASGTDSTATITNMPKISSNTFADSNGVLLGNLKFFVNESVIKFMVPTTSAESLVPIWYNLYRGYSDRFFQNKDEAIWVNADVVPSVYYKTSTDQANLIPNSFERGLVIRNTAGVLRYETLNVTNIDGSKFNTDEGVHIVNLIYSSVGVTLNNENTPADRVFSYTVYYAIGNGSYQFTDTNNTININANDSNSPITVLGLKETYFTTERLEIDNIELQYEDIAGTAVVVNSTNFIVKDDFSPINGQTKQLTITYNFNDIGTYVISWTYTGKKALLSSMEQAGSISLPLNSSANSYKASMPIITTAQDGIQSQLLLSNNAFTIYAVDGIAVDNSLTTDTLGFHKASVRYINSDAVDSKLEFVITYAVIMQTDVSAFTFSEHTTDSGVSVATVTGFIQTGLTTVIVPSNYRGAPVVAIGAHASSNSIAAESVEVLYIPSTVTTIGERAFANCTNLKYIYVYSRATTTPTAFTPANFSVLSESVVSQSSVQITGLTAAATDNIVVPNNMTYTDTVTKSNDSAVGGETYTSDIVYNCVVTFSATAFNSFKGNGIIYLYDTQENRTYVAEYLSAKFADGKVEFYTNDDNMPVSDCFIFANDYANNVTSSEIVQDRKLVNLNGFTSERELTLGTVYNYKVDGTATTPEENYTCYTVSYDDLTFNGNVLNLPDNIFDGGNISGNANLQVRVYVSATQSAYTTRDTFLDFVETIDKEAFKGCTALNVDFSTATRLQSIGYAAFSNCLAIGEIDLTNSSNLTDIDGNAFEYCANLESVKLPSSITAISNGLFYECINLTSVGGYGTLTFVGANAFYNTKIPSSQQPTVAAIV